MLCASDTAEKQLKKQQFSNHQLKYDTKNLVDAIFDSDYMAFSIGISSNLTPAQGAYERYKCEFNAVRELVGRKDAADMLFLKYVECFPKGNDPKVISACEATLLEFLFSDDFYGQLSEAQTAFLGGYPY